MVNVTSLADGNDGESESEQVEPGKKVNPQVCQE